MQDIFQDRGRFGDERPATPSADGTISQEEEDRILRKMAVALFRSGHEDFAGVVYDQVGKKREG